MKRLFYSVMALMAMCLWGCGSAGDRNADSADSARVAQDSINALLGRLKPGVPVSLLTGTPGAGWEVVVQYGVCCPDTLFLYATLQGHCVKTNVYRTGDVAWQNVSAGGASKCAEGEGGVPLALRADDFLPSAVVLSVSDRTAAQLREDIKWRVDTSAAAMRAVVEALYAHPDKVMDHVTKDMAERLKEDDKGSDFRFVPFYSDDVTTEVDRKSLSFGKMDMAAGEVPYTMQISMTDEDGGVTTDRARFRVTFVPDSAARFPAFLIDRAVINGHQY